MKIPQLVQEIIDYYLYFAPWKNGIKRVNMEYIKMYRMVGCKDESRVLLNIKLNYYYNWRIGPFHEEIFRPPPKSVVAKLPPRYDYSNTKEQLKSLFLI